MLEYKSNFVPEADGVSAGLFEPFCGEDAVDLIWSGHVQPPRGRVGDGMRNWSCRLAVGMTALHTYRLHNKENKSVYKLI